MTPREEECQPLTEGHHGDERRKPAHAIGLTMSLRSVPLNSPRVWGPGPKVRRAHPMAREQGGQKQLIRI